MSYRVLISVLNWNNAPATIQCLYSIQSLTYDAFDILVIDNASIDESVESIQSEFPEQDIYQTDENKGFAGGHAIAVSRLQTDGYDAVWLLNNDTIVQPGSLTALVDALASCGDDAIYSSVPLKSADDERIAFSSKYLIHPDFSENPLRTIPDIHYSDFFAEEDVRAVAVLPGSCLFIPAGVLAQYGFMDTNYFLYGEEVDYCLRLRKEGVACFMVAASRISHVQQGSQVSYPQLSRVVYYYRTRNLIFNTLRHSSLKNVMLIVSKRTIYAGLLLLMGLYDSPKKLDAIYILRGIMDALRDRRGKVVEPENYLTDAKLKRNLS